MRRNALVSAGVLFVLLVTAGLLRQQPDRQVTPTSYGIAPFGHKAAFDLLLELGLPVSRNLAPAKELPERATVWWIDPTSLCRTAGDEPSSPSLDEWSGRGWLERGGTAVVFLPARLGPPLCESVVGEALPSRPEPPPNTTPAPTPESEENRAEPPATPLALQGPRLRAVRNLAVPNLGTFTEAKDWNVGAETAGRPFLLERAIGEGRLVVVGDSSFLTNLHLGDADAAPLLIDLVNAYGAPLIDERDHGFGATSGTTEYLWHSAARPAFIGLAVLGLTFAWWGAALSPRTAAGDERPAPTLESYVTSLATLYARAGDHAAVAARYREFALAQLRRQSALPADTPADLLIERYQRQRRLDAGEARLLRETPALTTSAELQRYAAQLDEILRKAASS